MIRLVWMAVNAALATLFFGLIAIVASLLRVRGRVYFWATREWSRAVLWASRTPVIVHGLEKVDWSQPQVLVSNHVAAYDIFALASVIPVPYAFVAKKELERIPFFGTAWKAAGHISIDRSDRQRAVQSLRHAGEKIRRERSTVVIFAEGTRSRSGELLPFKKGAFVLAVEAGVQVVPTVVRGSDRILVGRPPRVVPHPIHVYFDTPVRPGELPDPGPEALMEAVRARMLALIERTAPAQGG